MAFQRTVSIPKLQVYQERFKALFRVHPPVSRLLKTTTVSNLATQQPPVLDCVLSVQRGVEHTETTQLIDINKSIRLTKWTLSLLLTGFFSM